MSKTSIPISELSISVSVIVGLVSLLVSGYIALIIRNINERISTIKEALRDIKINQEKHEGGDKKVFDEAFERIRDLETITTVIKNEHDHNHRRGQ